jgi:hypothetical protein
MLTFIVTLLCIVLLVFLVGLTVQLLRVEKVVTRLAMLVEAEVKQLHEE